MELSTRGEIFIILSHSQVVPSLLQVLDDAANPRVQAHAGAALVNFCDDCPKNILTPYLDNILAKLEAVLSSKLREVEWDQLLSVCLSVYLSVLSFAFPPM